MTVTRTKGKNRRQPQVTDLIRRALVDQVAAPAQPAEPAPTSTPASIAKAAPVKISQNVLARARRMKDGKRQDNRPPAEPFKAYNPPPGVLPQGAKPVLAMDSNLQTWAQDSYTAAWNFSNPYGGAFAEGVSFLGYAYLSELTQRPEYRRISERLAVEMTRKWIRLTVEGEADADGEDDIDPEVAEDAAAKGKAKPKKKPAKAAAKAKPGDDEQDGGEAGEPDEEFEPVIDPVQRARNEALQKKIKAIKEDMERLDVRGAFRKLAEHDGWFGRGHLYIDTGDSDDPDELLTSIGNGTDETSKAKFKKKDFLRALKVIEPIWCYPLGYNSNDPLADDWYNPQVWFAMSKQVHVSRLLRFVSREVPDILKPAYAFGGLSMSQMAKPYVDNWLRTRQAVTNLIESFSVSGIYTNAQSLLQGGGEEVLDRIELYNVTRTNAGAMVLDKESEEFFNVSTPLSTLDALQAQSQEQMSSVSGIPLIVLLGITPTGLNASSEGELRVFYDLINAMQEHLFRDRLRRVIGFIQLNMFGEIDPAIGFEFEPLWSLDEKGEAEVKKIEMETHTGYIDAGVVAPDEVRVIVVEDEDSPYNGLDPDDLPEPPAEMGLILPGGEGGEGGEGGKTTDRSMGPAGGAADSAITEVAEGVFAFDEFDESKVKRDQGGKFSETGAGGGAAGEEPSFKSKKEHIAHLLTKGTTPKALMQAMGWPSVSMPAQAASLGMKLDVKVVDGQKVYTGTPMTDAEKSAFKQAQLDKKKGKETDAAAAQILNNAGIPPAAVTAKVEPVAPAPKKTDVAGELNGQPKYPAKPEAPKATPAEMEKAKKATTLSLQLLPGEKPSLAGSPQTQGVVSQIKAFNDKYANKQLSDPAELAEKVQAFKDLQAYAGAAAKEETAKKAEIEKAVKAEAQKKAKAEAAKAAEDAKRAAEKNAKMMAELGISAQQAEGVGALAKMLGSKTGEITESFKQYAAEAESLGYPISGFQCALIKSYSNGSYHAVNDSLRSGAWTPAQHVYVSMVNKALAAMPAHTGTVNRGASLSAEQIARYKEGHIVQENAFTSTSTAGGFSGNARFKINAIGKRGASIKKLSNSPGENEVLFQARTFFKVNKVTTVNGVTEIHMDEFEEH